MAIRLYEDKMEFDYDSTNGDTIRTHTIHIDSNGLIVPSNTKIIATGDPGVTVDSTVASDSTGLSKGDFELYPNYIAFGKKKMSLKSDGSGIIFTGEIMGEVDSVSAITAAWTPDLISTTSSSPSGTLKSFLNIYYRRTIIAAVYLDTELQAAFGKSSATISGMRFDVVEQPLYQPLPDYAIGMKENAAGNWTTATDPGDTGYTIVKSQASESFTTGSKKEFTFTTNFNWTGGDLAIVCAWGQCPTNYNASGKMPYGAGNVQYRHADQSGTYVINTDTMGSTLVNVRPVIQLYGG